MGSTLAASPLIFDSDAATSLAARGANLLWPPAEGLRRDLSCICP